MGATCTTLASLSIPDSKRGNRVHGTLTFRGVQHLEVEEPSPRSTMEVICSVPERTVLSVAMLTLRSEDRALMLILVAVRAGTWLRMNRA